MKIQPIVEGHGEVAALPALLRRLRDEAGVFHIDVGPPIRRTRHQLVTESELRRSVELALLQPHCGAVLILLDSDDDCPAELGPRLQQLSQTAARGVPCAVVLAHREYEAWFLGAMESLRGKRGIDVNAVSLAEPERPRDAKRALEAFLPARRSYSEMLDQPALSAVFDLSSSYRLCRSFRKLVTSFGDLAGGMSGPLKNWPPAAWTTS